MPNKIIKNVLQFTNAIFGNNNYYIIIIISSTHHSTN